MATPFSATGVAISDASPAPSAAERTEGQAPLMDAPARRRQWQALFLICLGIFCALSIWFSASAVLTSMMDEWGISKQQGSFLTSFVNVGFCCGCLVSAVSRLADRTMPQGLILFGSVGAAAAQAALLLVEGFAGALVCRFLIGTCLALVYPPGVKLLSTWFSAQERGMATGIMFGAFCLGSAFPQLLRGVLSDVSWRPMVVSTSVASALSGALLYVLIGTGPFPLPTTGALRISECARGILCNHRVSLSIVAYCGHMWELFCVWAWIAQFVEHSWLMSPRTAPFVAFAVISMGGPGSWLGGLLGDRLGRVRVAAASLAVSGVCVGVLGLLAHEGPLFIRLIIFLLWGLTALSDSPQFSAIITVSTDQQLVGTAVTLQLLSGYLMTVLALWVVPWIADEISWRWAFFSLVAGPVVGLTALFCMGRKDGAAALRGADDLVVRRGGISVPEGVNSARCRFPAIPTLYGLPRRYEAPRASPVHATLAGSVR